MIFADDSAPVAANSGGFIDSPAVSTPVANPSVSIDSLLGNTGLLGNYFSYEGCKYKCYGYL